MKILLARYPKDTQPNKVRGIVIIRIGQLSGGDGSGDLSGVGFTRIEIVAAARE